jgi:hypothetical protein
MRRFLLALLLVPLAGCDLSEDDFEPQVVVEAFLVADEFLPTIRLSETAPIDARYTFEAYALSGAEVELALLDAGGDVEETFGFYENVDVPGNVGSFPGNYVPLDGHRVLPNRRYRLTARVPERVDLVPSGELIRAETLVPDTFRVVRFPPDTIRYNILAPSPALDVTPSVGENQAVYIFSIEALDPDNYELTPTIASLLENADDVDESDFVTTSSPLLNEGNYERNADGTLRLRVPWFAIAYYGPNRLSASALDDALFDFIRSRDAQFNPTTLSPGEIQRVLSNVENGTGVFGSLATVTTEAFIAE